MSNCEFESCENEADYIDAMDNKVCEEHMQKMIEEEGERLEDFDPLDDDYDPGEKSGTCWDCAYKKPDGKRYGNCEGCEEYSNWSPE